MTLFTPFCKIYNKRQIFKITENGINNIIMTGETQSQIQKFLFNLSNQDFANADKELKNIVQTKLNDRFKQAFEQVKSQVKTSK